MARAKAMVACDDGHDALSTVSRGTRPSVARVGRGRSSASLRRLAASQPVDPGQRRGARGPVAPGHDQRRRDQDDRQLAAHLHDRPEGRGEQVGEIEDPAPDVALEGVRGAGIGQQAGDHQHHGGTDGHQALTGHTPKSGRWPLLRSAIVCVNCVTGYEALALNSVAVVTAGSSLWARLTTRVPREVTQRRVHAENAALMRRLGLDPEAVLGRRPSRADGRRRRTGPGPVERPQELVPA